MGIPASRGGLHDHCNDHVYALSIVRTTVNKKSIKKIATCYKKALPLKLLFLSSHFFMTVEFIWL